MNRPKHWSLWSVQHWRSLATGFAALIVLACLWKPELPLPRKVLRYMVVFDITQSMNARDYHLAGMPQDRLGYAKESVRRLMHELPCGSEIGLGLFTTQTVHFLFDPLEICHHFSILDDVLGRIDWRMAWSADTHVEMGLYHALREIKKNLPGTRIAFLTDGQETPPQTARPLYDGKPGEIGGALIGVGGVTPVAVPRYDRENHLVGNWENADIEKPPVSTTVYSEKVFARTLPRDGVYLSWVDEPHLRVLSAGTGLHYARLDAPEEFSRLMLSENFAEVRPTPTDIRPWLGIIALLLLTLVYVIDGKSRGSGRISP